MPFTPAEIEYLQSQRLGRLATARPDGTLQVSPVGFHLDAERGTVDIGGFNLATTRKFLNVADNGRVAFVVDDLRSVDPWRVRCLEVRGTGEAIARPEDGAAPGRGDGALIRIHPRRIISFGIDEDRPPHEMVANNRDVA